RRASDGAIRWVALTGRIAFEDDDLSRPVRAIGTLRDITRRRESVEELRHSEARLAPAQEAGHIGTFDWDLAPATAAMSTTQEAALGPAARSFPGKYAAIQAVIHPADQQRVDANLKAALDRRDQYSDEFRILRGDGAVRWIAARASITRSTQGTVLRMI